MKQNIQKVKIFALFIFTLVISVFIAVGCSNNDSADNVTIHYNFSSLHSVSLDNPVVKKLTEIGIAVNNEVSIEHNGLVVDGDKISADEMETNGQVKEFLKNHKALVVLNCTAEHKEALVKYVGISFGKDSTKAYCVIPIEGTYGRKFSIVEHPTMYSFDVQAFIDNLKAQGKEVEFNEDEYYKKDNEFREKFNNESAPEKFAEKVLNLMNENAAIKRGERDSTTVPAGLKYKTWRYYHDSSWTVQNIWLRKSGNSYQWVMPATAPMQGYQTLYYSPTYNIALYLDNDSANANGDYQWLTVDYTSASNPQSDHSVYVKDTSIDMPSNGHEYGIIDGNEKADLYAFGQMLCVFNFFPDPYMTGYPNPVDYLKYYDSQPYNQNNTTTYQSGYTISVGFSTSGVDSKFTVENRVSTEITDWFVKNETNNANLNFKWEWLSSNPYCYGDEMHYLNNLNTGLFQPNASCVMQSKTLVKDKLYFDIQDGITQMSWGAKYSVTGGDLGKVDWTSSTYIRCVGINFGSVLYPIVESLSVSPNQVQGGTNTTGTVTLDENAPEGGTTVTLTSSNPNWASVPETVVVPEGLASATFPITTYSVTGNSVATIKGTLEGLTVDAQLTVTP